MVGGGELERRAGREGGREGRAGAQGREGRVEFKRLLDTGTLLAVVVLPQ